MKEFIKDNKILILIIVIGILSAVFALAGRWQVENGNKTYDIVLDYQEMDKMAKQSGESLEWWFEKSRDWGVTKVALPEESLTFMANDANLPVAADVMFDVVKAVNWQDQFPEEFMAAVLENGWDDYDVVVEAGSKETFDFITGALEERWENDRYLYTETEAGGFIFIDGDANDALYSETYKSMDSTKKGFTEFDDVVGSKIMYLSLGLSPERVAQIENAGLSVIPRTYGYNGWNDTRYAEAVLKGYETNLKTTPAYLIPAGEAVIGSDDDTVVIAEYMTKTGMAVSLIENTTQLQNIMQDGLDRVVERTDYQAVRVFSVWNYIQNRYQYYGYEGAKEIENTLFRAITERNVRVIYYKPIKEFKDHHIYVTDADEYTEMFDNLAERLAAHGFTVGNAKPMEAYQLRLRLKILMGFGAAAAAVLLLRTIFPIKRKYALGLAALGCVGAAGAMAAAPNLALLLLSFASAVIFPCLAVSYLVKSSKEYSDSLNREEKLGKVIGVSVAALTVSLALSLLGSVMTAAPLSTISHMLEIDIFRGVKISQLLPLGFFILAYLAYFGFGAKKEKAGRLETGDLMDMMTTKIQVWMAVLAVVIAGVGYYYIIRTGHDTNVEPSTIEMLFRNALEDNLIARPRNKEFLFAFPAAMLFVYASVKRLKLFSAVFGLCSCIGFTSVVNTFMHIRTPLYLGFARTGYSLVFGIVIGVIGILVFDVLYQFYRKMERQLS